MLQTMARVPCICGQPITTHNFDGTPRSSCPFCKRQLTWDSDGKLIMPATTNRVTPREETPFPIVAEEAPVATYSVSASNVSSGDSRSAPSPAITAKQGSSAVTGPARFVEGNLLGSAVTRLAVFVNSVVQKQPRSPGCQQHPQCDVANCSRAFTCGALPHDHSGWLHLLFWTLVPSGGMLVLSLGSLLIVERAAKEQAASATKPNYAAGVALLLGVSFFLALVGGWWGWLTARARQRYIRAIARGAQHAGLPLLPFVEVPELLANTAIPVVRLPSPMVMGEVLPAHVHLISSGALHGTAIHLVQYTYRYDPLDVNPLGGFAKTVLLIVKPSAARRPHVEGEKLLVAYFPEPLTRTPDFLLTPDGRNVQATYVKKAFGDRRLYLASGTSQYLLNVPPQSTSPDLGEALTKLLMGSPGWTIQVVGGRLLVWRGRSHLYWPLSLPQGDSVVELLAFASQVRQLLLRQSVSMR